MQGMKVVTFSIQTDFGPVSVRVMMQLGLIYYRVLVKASMKVSLACYTLPNTTQTAQNSASKPDGLATENIRSS